MANDTVKAWQNERPYLEALKHMSAEDRTAVLTYVSGLLDAMKLVNRTLVAHTAGGSEYWDERGSVHGSLLAADQIIERSKSNWEAFREERLKNIAKAD